MDSRSACLSLVLFSAPFTFACSSSTNSGPGSESVGGQAGNAGTVTGSSGGSTGLGGAAAQTGGNVGLGNGGASLAGPGGSTATGIGGSSVGAGGSGGILGAGGSTVVGSGGSVTGSGGQATGAGGSPNSTCVSGVGTGDACDPLVDTTTCVRSTRTCVCATGSSQWTCTPTDEGTGGGIGAGGTGAGGQSTGSGGELTGTGGQDTGTGGAAAGAPGSGGMTGDMPTVYTDEDTGADCPAPTFPAFSALEEIAYLPDPFLKADGTPITTRAEWRCRRAEIKAIVEHWDVGEKPVKPTTVDASLSGNTISITVGEGGQSFQMSVEIARPPGAASGPIPAIIGINTPTGSLPSDAFSSRGIATITYDSGQLAPSSFTGGGTFTDGNFYRLYPETTAGYMIRWAWGVSRIIDALEALPEANIDVSHLAVSGCSFQGKIALYAGAFDERIRLTIPHESGGGGTISWRYSDMLEDRDNTEVENLHHALGAPWYAQAVAQFANSPNKLPFDHHELIAMIAPRAVLAIESSQIARMGAEAARVDALAAREIWTALGVPYRMGATEENTGHCTWHEGFTPALEAYLDAFLLDKADVDTNILRSSFTSVDTATWLPWETPALE